jgi:hypothetical protein
MVHGRSLPGGAGSGQPGSADGGPRHW